MFRETRLSACDMKLYNGKQTNNECVSEKRMIIEKCSKNHEDNKILCKAMERLVDVFNLIKFFGSESVYRCEFVIELKTIFMFYQLSDLIISLNVVT